MKYAISPDMVGQLRIDPDTRAFLSLFDEEIGSIVLEVGAHDEGASVLLSQLGFNVVGTDLREYDTSLPACNYAYVQVDFCTWKPDRQFDVCFTLSAIEHFGLGTYREGPIHYYYDVLAMRRIWESLK